ncbi:hypothetical protein SPSYN_01079 [Sporotomaculum syntrophicum]|uniref:Uncharacterized protein n=1 Tax=Sporotomaculum syntrophicum TaxID=182264 RepID=A0A9D3AYN2_9FIRM|nr:hypothetical protein [Sporotomaculum syntrophicum]KAF1084943.1 hypothetical protein SPSYN_01079 [Sporotomaculum syntrophicum]
MSQADFQARIKKIEIVNKVLTDSWAQSIRVSLEDIELTNDNLLELRRFRPNETVDVVLKSVQPDLFELAAKRRGGAVNLEDGEDNEELVTFTEEDAGQPVT